MSFKILAWISTELQMSFQGTGVQKKLMNHAPTAHLLLDKEKALKMGGFDSHFKRVGEDLDFSHRCTQQGLSFLFTSSTVLHIQNLSLQNAIEKFFNYGRAQARVICRNGFIKARSYRMLPLGLFIFTLLSMILIGNRGLNLLVFLGAIVLGLPLIYGAGTFYEFFRTIFRISKK